MKALRYSEILNRVNRSKYTEPTVRSNVVSMLYESVIENKQENDVLKLIDACSNNRDRANIYAKSIAEMVDNSYKSLRQDYITKITPIINRFVLKNVVETANISDDFRSLLEEEFNKNNISANIVNNHYEVMKEYDIEEFARKPRVTVEMVVNKICDIFNEFNIKDYGKFQAAIMESVFLFDKLGIQFNEHEVIKYISEYYSMQSSDSKINRLMSGSLSYTNLSLILNEDFFSNDKDSDSDVERICDKFIEDGDISINSLNNLKRDIISCDADDIGSHFNKYLNILFRILCMEDKDSESRYILNDIVPKIYSDIDSDRNNRDFITRIEWQITKIDNYLTNYDTPEKISRRLNTYKENLNDIHTLLDNDLEVMYTEYNNMCINDNRNELNKTMSLNEYKIFKFDNLITRTMKLDNYIQKKFEPSRQKIFNKIKNTKDEIFNSDEKKNENMSIRESVDIYDVLTPDGDIDYCVSTYEYSTESTQQLNEYLTNIIMDVNENILNETDLTCYYLLSPDYIEFHVKEYANIQFTDEERAIVENHITNLDEDRILKIMIPTYSINENFDYINDATKFFVGLESNKERNTKFKNFLEISANIGVSKEIINELYESINDELESTAKISFKYMCSSIIEEYTPRDLYPESKYLALAEAQSLLEGTHDEYNAVNTKDLSKYGYHGEDEKKKKVKEEDQDIQPHKYNKPELAEDDYEDQVKSGVNDAISATRTNAKLIGKGMSKGVKDFDAKAQRAFKMSDVIFNRAIKSCKDALVSDRREAIIKGSVIPSFSKSIKIGIVLATLGAVTNPAVSVIAAIGGLIASKKLTERERSLLLDDIEVELNVIDKEIQIAESNNQMNKYRALMKMKKDLQRQYQRIRYNIRYKRNKIRIPSKTGVDVEE